MRCPGPTACSPVGMHALMADPPLRESVADPPLLSSYRRFWAGATPWARFLLPGHQQGEAIHQTRSQPGVYEFGASLPQSPATVVPLYVGKSSNVRSRHLAYLATGDHLKELMLPALDQGCTVWQRVRYLDSDLQAQRWEAKCLVEFDYAWNQMLNPPKRRVRLEYRDCCCLPVAVDVVDEGRGRRVSVLAAPLAACSGRTAATALLLQAVLAAAVVGIVAGRLQRAGSADPGATQLTSQCLLGAGEQGRSLCTYAYVVAGSSMVASLALGVLMASSRTLCCCGSRAFDAALSTCMALWWVAAAGVLTRFQRQADEAGTPALEWRHAVCVLAWVEAGLWAAVAGVRALLGMVTLCSRRSQPRAAAGGGDPEAGMERPTAPTAPPDWARQRQPPQAQFIVGA